MAIELVRVVLTPAVADDDLAARLQFILDLQIDAETQACAGPRPAFGRRGDFTRVETLYPFTLMADGRIDYGQYAAPEARQDNLDIRGRTIVVGGSVTYRSAEEHSDYVIKSVTALAG